MRIVVGSDESTELTDSIIRELEQRGHQVEAVGPPAGQPLQWVDVAQAVAQRVAQGQADEGVLCCWTGTGVSIAANKVSGVRAALCGDPETARGARAWNQANVLCLSLRNTPVPLGKEIIDAWLSAQPDPSETANVEKLIALDRSAHDEAN
jgi:ribose 5-phosphate isomerase B